MREFRFGFNVSGLRPARELADLCRTAEEFGYDVVVSTDHLTSGSPFSPLVAAAEATQRMRVGTLTVNNEFWNPALLARETVTVDWLTGGRLELGLGAGHMKWEFDVAGLPWRPFGERVARLGRTVEELQRLFTDGVPEPDSATQSREWFGRPELRPVQRHGFGGAGPPLLIGGTGDRVLRLAALHADIVGCAGVYQVDGQPPGTFRLGTAAEADDRVGFVRWLAGDRADQMEGQRTRPAGHGHRRPPERGREPRGGAPAVLHRRGGTRAPFLLIGTEDQIADQLRSNRERFGFSYITVHEPYMRELGPVIQQLRA